MYVIFCNALSDPLGAAETARLRAVLVEKDELLAHRTEEAARVEVLAAVVRVAEEAHVQDLETDVAQLTEKLRAEKEKRVALNVQLTAAANDFSALKEEAITARKDATDATMLGCDRRDDARSHPYGVPASSRELVLRPTTRVDVQCLSRNVHHTRAATIVATTTVALPTTATVLAVDANAALWWAASMEEPRSLRMLCTFAKSSVSS